MGLFTSSMAESPNAPATDSREGVDTQHTLPYSDSHFELLRVQGILKPDESLNHDADDVPELGPCRDASPEKMGLNQLVLEKAPQLRILFQQPEHGVQVTLTAEQSEEFEVGAPDTEHETKTKVLGAMQSRAGVSCSYEARRIKATIFFIPGKDDVLFRNETDDLLFLKSIPNGLDIREILPRQYVLVYPGFWQLRDDETTVEFLLRSRRYGLLKTDEAVKRSAGQSALSSKRPKRSVGAAGAASIERVIQNQVQKTMIRSSPVDIDLLHTIGLGKNQTLNVVDSVTGQLEYSIKRIGQYLQRNKNADVVKAIWHEGSSKPTVVAVKMHKIPNTDPHDTAAVIKRWDREFQVHRSLDHPCIAKLLAFDSRLLALIVEHQDSYDLSSPYWCAPSGPRARCFKGTSDDACFILADISRALAYLAEQGLVHNDIKAANILYREPGSVGGAKAGAVLIDFGLSRVMKDQPWDMGGGAPWYLPPEWIRQEKREPPADIFSLGVVMLYALRCMSLPDKTKGWNVNAVQQQSPEAIASMEEWQDFIIYHRDNLKLQHLKASRKEAKLHLLVHEMLSTLPNTRISPRELTRQTREWTT